MQGMAFRSLAVALSALGIGLILNSMIIGGIIAISSGIGLWMGDFRLLPANERRGKRLVAKGSPALLLLPLMLAAGKIYTATTDSLAAQYGYAEQCNVAADAGLARLRMLIRML